LLLWEGGVIEVTFKQQYESDWVKLTQPFSETPYVFVSDSLPHAWIIVKTDEIRKDTFKWAATIIGGPRPGHQMRLQWLAISKPAAAPVAEEESAFQALKKLLDEAGAVHDTGTASGGKTAFDFDAVVDKPKS
jgi:hypothetical protein